MITLLLYIVLALATRSRMWQDGILLKQDEEPLECATSARPKALYDRTQPEQRPLRVDSLTRRGNTAAARRISSWLWATETGKALGRSIFFRIFSSTV